MSFSAPVSVVLWFLLGLAVSVVMTRGAFDSGRITADEGSYVFQAGNFLDGRVRRSAEGLDPFLEQDMIILNPEDGWLSRYAPGHSAWLVPGVALGWPQLMTAVGCGLSLALAACTGKRLGLPRWLLPMVMLWSPFFWLMYGTLLSHTSGMVASWVMAYGYVRWREEGGSGWAALAGAGWSLLVLNRTWTALLIAFPFGVHALWTLWKGRTDRKVWTGVCLFAGCAAVGVGLFAAYNDATTGDPGLSTYLLYEESENLGFGPRRVQGGAEFSIDHTLERGIGFFKNNLAGLDRWLFGWPWGGLVVWGGLAVVGWRKTWSPLLLGAFLMVPLGYIYFWFPGIPEVGPLYLFEGMPFFLLAGGLGLWRLVEWSRKFRGWRWGWAGVMILSGWAAAGFGQARMQAILERFDLPWKAEAMIQDLPGRNLILIDPSLNSDRDLRHYVGLNDRGFNSRNLRLRLSPSYFAAASQAYPDRQTWVLSRKGEDLRLTRLEPPGPVGVQTRKVEQTQGEGRVAKGVRLSPSSEGWLCWGWYPMLPPGDYRCVFDLKVAQAEEGRPVRVEVMADWGRAQLAAKELIDTKGPVVLDFRVDRLTVCEPRVWFSGSGTARLSALRIEPR